jgi:hypothetical protein
VRRRERGLSSHSSGMKRVSNYFRVIVNPYPSVQEEERMKSRFSYIGVSMEWSADHEHSMDVCLIVRTSV